ncbi:MAG TPA: class I SAM-dependent methyltransferase [bacterium]|nr:class I SAM-dependent methyltransferase [bacterium]
MMNCRACGSERTEKRFPGASLDLLRCQDCGAMFRPGEVTQEDLSRLYNEDYFLKSWPGSLGRFFSDFDPARHNKTRFLQKQLAELTRLAGKKGRLLDVGCANGVFVWMAKQSGWQAEGVELSRFAAARGREQFQVVIHEGTVDDMPDEPAFDVITLWDTLEHVSDPSHELHACFQRLAPGGIIAVLTPDASSLINRVVHAAHIVAPRALAPLLEKLYHADHLTCFDRQSLARALVKQGFQIQWVQGYDEAPEDTETAGLVRLGVLAVRVAAMIAHREHELLILAGKPKPRHHHS